MATFNKFNSFLEAVFEGSHDFSSDTVKVMLTNDLPVATDTQKSDLTEITAGNGYTAGGNTCTLTSSTNTSGTYNLILASPAIWTATGGAINTFQYAVMYNDTHASDLLIGWWDYGSALSVVDGATFEVTLASPIITGS